jgi:hypothetical protein
MTYILPLGGDAVKRQRGFIPKAEEQSAGEMAACGQRGLLSQMLRKLNEAPPSTFFNPLQPLNFPRDSKLHIPQPPSEVE